jgi:hypothetical protein
MKHRILSLVCAVVSLWLASGNVHAAVGSVKVECFGRCDLITLSQVCDTYRAGSRPIAIACDDTAFGAALGNLTHQCGGGHCRQFGSLSSSDRVSDYCSDSPGYDAVVTCQDGSTTLGATAHSLEDEEQKPTDGEEDTTVDR